MQLRKMGLVPSAIVLLAMVAGALVQDRQVAPFDTKRETASARTELEAKYGQLHSAIEQGNLDPVQNLFDSYFEVHNNLAGLAKDDDYQDYAEWSVDIEEGDSLFHWAGPQVSQSRVRWKLASFVSGRRFASALVETVQNCERELDGKKVKAEIRTKCVDVWQQREAIDSKATKAFDWNLEYREVVSVEVKIDGKAVPIEISG